MSKLLLTTICLSAALLIAGPVFAQNGAPQVSAVTLQVVQNSDGSQSVITPKGDLARLPGPGVNGNVAQIYMGAQGGFWYTDRNNQTVDLSEAVKMLQARRASTQAPVQVPQYAPQPYYQQQQAPVNETTNNYNSGGGGSSNGAMQAVGTAAAAGLGAMAGAAMTGSYYNAPYGTPMHYGANGNPYYYNNGVQQNFEDLNQNQKMAMYNHNQVKQQNQLQSQQAALQQTQTNQQNRQSTSTTNQGNRQAAYGGQQDYQKQQQWYQDQQKQNPNRFQKADSNPFVNQNASAGSGDRNFAQNRDGGERSGGFGNRAGGERAGGFGGGERAGGFGGLRGGGGRRGR